MLVWLFAAVAAIPDQRPPAMDESWESAQRQQYSGLNAGTREAAQAYTGEAAANAIAGEERRRAYLLNYEQLRRNYGENVEYQLRREQVILCPQTYDYLYGAFTPLRTRYTKGSRPALESVVSECTRDAATERERALALMRLCRDLYLKEPGRDFKTYVYGGTEEQLLEKGEILCECLGRLYVALCEVAGIPARVVMHDIGGHITAEAFVDGSWAYIDPRLGVYCVKPDGALASTLDLWQQPGLWCAQKKEVKAEISPNWTPEEWAWRLENKYFHPSEVIGFQNYSLDDADRYSYAQKTYTEAEKDGLFVINKEYVASALAVFGLEGDGYRRNWETHPLRRVPIAYRHDGFSMFFTESPLTRERIERDYVDALAGTNAEILVWGLGPGSVFCYDTEIGEVFGENLSDEELAMMREGDRWVHRNVTSLIEQGNDPLQVAIARAREKGLKLLARLEMNHEYGPADPNNWMWVGLVGQFNKQHPEYRIPGRVLLDFKHPEVRAFKLAILREAAEAGADGISMDFAVYPPFFETPDAAMMTQFVRDVRTMLNDVGAEQERTLELMARVPYRDTDSIGLDWRTWMRERIVDYIVPTHCRPNETFDIPVEEFVSMGHRTGVKVYPTVWQALGFVTTDQEPEDDATGQRRYDKPKTRGMYAAQALLFHRAGVDGLQLGFSEDQWVSMPWLNDLADPEKLLFADKHYMVDPSPHCPVVFEHGGERTVPLRVADDIAAATAAGRDVTAELVLYAQPMGNGDHLDVFVNGQGPAAALSTGPAESPVEVRGSDRSFIFDREWWRRGELRVSVRAEWWRLGENEIAFRFTPGEGRQTPFAITWVDLLLDYRER